MYELWEDLKRLKRCRWVELSHPLNNDSPYWGGIPEGAVELSKTVYDWGNELECLIQTFKFPGQFGTHIDFPGHFIKGEALSEQYGVKDILSACGPLCRSRFSAYNLWHSGEIRPWQMKPVPAFFRLCRWTVCRRALWEQRQCLYIGTA